MKVEHWKRVRQVFLAALELPLDERGAFVRRECGDDEDLLLDVRRLLGSQVAPGFLEPPPVEQIATPLEALAGLRPGQEVAGYRLEQEIGHGGMGVVFSAVHQESGQRVAVKVLSPHLHLSPTAVERFKREARAAARLDHPGIVPVTDFVQEAGCYFFAMELVEGPSLADLAAVRRSPRAEPASGVARLERPVDTADPRVCAELAARIADALEHAHRHGVIHRDVKPQNVLLDPDGTPRLADFGLARDAEVSSMTRTGEVAGTPHYMSPEQALSRIHQIDHRTDIYSLGAVLYELLTLRRPFEGGTQQEVLYKITHDDPTPIEVLAPSVPRALALVCMKALRREPERRYATAADMAADLRRFLDGEDVHARPPSLASHAGRMLRRPRNVARALPAVLGIGVLGGWLWKVQNDRAEELASRPIVRLALEEPGPDAQVRVRPRVVRPQGWGEAGEPRSLDARGLDLRLEPGSYLIVVEDGDGRFAELARDLEREQELEETVRLASVDEVAEGMVRVDAVQLETQLGIGPDLRGTVDVGAVWVDRACVTNGEYAEFLAATGRDAPKGWPDDPSAGPADLPRPDWRELPVTAVTHAEARAYAEWAGKRLPSAWELLAAFGADDPGWLEQALSEDPPPFALYGEDQLVDDPAGEPSALLGYLKRVRPARGPGERPFGPYGMLHPVDNVLQLTETPGWELGADPSGADPESRPESRLQVGNPWHWDLYILRTRGLTVSSQMDVGQRSRDLGFRCAKSAAP